MFRILWEEYVEKLDISHKVHATYKAGDYKTRKIRKIKLGQASITFEYSLYEVVHEHSQPPPTSKVELRSNNGCYTLISQLNLTL